MEEVCPVCSDIMSEINVMFDWARPRNMAELSWTDISTVREALTVMYTAEAVVHFISKWHLVVSGLSGHGDNFPAQRSSQYQTWLDL